MEDLSLHILDVVENATAAGASRVEITIRRDRQRDLLEIVIADNGRGMDAQMVEKVRDPFVTTRTTRRVGLGLPLLEQSAREAGGTLEVRSTPGQGTTVRATFRDSHIDRRPLGDIGGTLVTLILGNPDTDFALRLDLDGRETVVDTRELRAQLDGTALTDPAVLRLVRQLVQQGMSEPSGRTRPERDREGGQSDG